MSLVRCHFAAIGFTCAAGVLTRPVASRRQHRSLGVRIHGFASHARALTALPTSMGQVMRPNGMEQAGHAASLPGNCEEEVGSAQACLHDVAPQFEILGGGTRRQATHWGEASIASAEAMYLCVRNQELTWKVRSTRPLRAHVMPSVVARANFLWGASAMRRRGKLASCSRDDSAQPLRRVARLCSGAIIAPGF